MTVTGAAGTMKDEAVKIFCVEDDTNIRDLVVYALRSGGFEAEGFAEAEPFFRRLRDERPALALLDIMLPDTDGMAILRMIREKKETRDLPVILLTAKGSEFDKVKGLDEGADDYITKPFGIMELLSRVRAVLRRTRSGSAGRELAVGPLRLNSEQRRAAVGGRELILTFKEFELLHYLMRNEGLVLSRDKLLEEVWGYDYEGETRTVDVHIRSLRQKLEDAADLIDTVRGVGYRIRSLE